MSTFVRQKTPHPRELKAKAHKLFGNKKPLDEGQREDHEQNGQHDHQQPRTFFAEEQGSSSLIPDNNEPVVAAAAAPPNTFAAASNDDEEDNDEEVSVHYYYYVSASTHISLLDVVLCQNYFFGFYVSNA